MATITEVELITDNKLDEIERSVAEVIRDVEASNEVVAFASVTAFGFVMAKYAAALVAEVKAARGYKN